MGVDATDDELHNSSRETDRVLDMSNFYLTLSVRTYVAVDGDAASQ